jgi:hypothetical protein
MAKASRTQLRAAREDVASQILVVGATRKKQRLMGTLELAAQVGVAKDLGLYLK